MQPSYVIQADLVQQILGHQVVLSCKANEPIYLPLIMLTRPLLVHHIKPTITRNHAHLYKQGLLAAGRAMYISLAPLYSTQGHC